MTILGKKKRIVSNQLKLDSEFLKKRETVYLFQECHDLKNIFPIQCLTSRRRSAIKDFARMHYEVAGACRKQTLLRRRPLAVIMEEFVEVLRIILFIQPLSSAVLPLIPFLCLWAWLFVMFPALRASFVVQSAWLFVGWVLRVRRALV